MQGRGMGWDVLVGIARGSVHVRAGIPLQDAVGWWPGAPDAGGPNPRVVLAVSDGVGSRDCFRSDTGARLAVEIACATGAELIAAAGAVRGGPSVATGLLTAVVERWTAAARADLERSPIRAAELTGTSAGWTDGDPLLAYAATLLIAVAADGGLLLAQIGDGEVVTVAADGRVRCPLPPDPTSIAGTTASLAQPDAVAAGRGITVDLASDAVEVVLLSTDGYGNAFAEPDWRERVGRDVRDQLREDGATAVAGRLAGWVGDAADIGGDDASLAVLSRVRSGP